MKTFDFSETIAASDLKVGRIRHLNEFTTMSNLAKLVFVLIVGPDIR